MTHDKFVRAVFPGSFDPLTNGHLDVIHRSVNIFDELIVAVGDSPDKSYLFTADERVGMIRQLIIDLPQVTVDRFSGLTVEYVKSKNAHVILRGLRNLTDVEYEFKLALTNRTIAGIETVFIMTDQKYGFTSASLIKEIGRYGGDISRLVPPLVYRKFIEKLDRKKSF